MNDISVRNYLEQAKEIDKRLDLLISEKKSLYCLVHSPRYGEGGHSNINEQKGLSYTLEKADKLQKTIDYLIERHIALKVQMLDVIMKVPDYYEQFILHSYYILNMTFKKIADMKYTSEGAIRRK